MECQKYATGANRAVCQQFVSTQRRTYDTVDEHLHITRIHAQSITDIEYNTFEMAVMTEPHDPLRVNPIEC